MNKSNLTLVTGLWDINRGNLKEFSRSFEHYKECFSRLLKLDFNMVIYCDEFLNEFIWKYRKHENTHIINKSLKDLEAFPFANQVEEIRNKKSWRNQAGWLENSPQAQLKHYNLITLQKQFMLNDATLFNPFNTEYALWVDAGLANTVSLENYFDATFERRITKHMNKMLYICFPYDGTVEVHGFEKTKLNELADANTQFVARGGVFGGSKFAINDINDIYYNLLDQTLNAGFMGTEESIFTIIAHKHRSKCNVRMIEDNGLVVKFFEDLKKENIKTSDTPLAFYILTFNLPNQLEFWITAFKKAYPKEFAKHKKYVINNSNDPKVSEQYASLFKDNNIEVIHEGNNIGINDGRALAAKHFENSDHDYMVFFEDDMLMHNGDIKVCKNGFNTFTEGLFDKAIQILDNNQLDYLKLSFSEFFGDNHDDWAWFNVPASKKAIYFSSVNATEKGLEKKTHIDYTGQHRGISFAVGNYHYCNWPLLFSRKGNRRVFLDVEYEHKYEQTIMSHTRSLIHDKKIKAGCLLMSTINHVRKYHYDKEDRKENKH